MAQLFANNAYSSLGASLSAVATSLTLATGTGSRFPSPTGGDHFLLTLAGLDSNGNENAWEIVRVTARSTDTLTIVRAQEGTTAALWASGTRVEMRATKGTFDGLLQLTGGTITGPVSVMNGAYTALKVGVTGLVSVGGEAGSAEAKFTITDGGNAGLEFSPTAIAGANRILSYNRASMAFASMTLMASDIKLNVGGTDRVTVDGSGNVTFTGTISSPTLAGKANLSGATFTGPIGATAVRVTGTYPTLEVQDTDGPTDKKNWRWGLDGGTYRLENVNDAYNAIVMTPISVDSVGNVGFGQSPSYPVDVLGKARATTGFAVGSDGSDFSTGSGSVPNYGVGFLSGSGEAVFSGFGGVRVYTEQVQRFAITGGGQSSFTNSVGFGYGAGSGGTVTQATSKGTAVTLNKPSGQITTSSDALAAGASAAFTVFNSTMNFTDSVAVTADFNVGAPSEYRFEVIQCNIGAFSLRITNISGISRSESLRINFAIIKGSTT